MKRYWMTFFKYLCAFNLIVGGLNLAFDLMLKSVPTWNIIIGTELCFVIFSLFTAYLITKAEDLLNYKDKKNE